MKYETNTAYSVAPSEIELGGFQPQSRVEKDYFETDAGKEFIDSVKAQGIQTHIPVYLEDGKLHLKTGRHRYAAAEMLGIEIPVVVVAKSANSEDDIVLQFTTNKQRPTSLLESGEMYDAYSEAVKERTGTKPKLREIASVFGTYTSTVSNCLAMVNSPKLLQNALVRGAISAKGAKAIAKSIKDEVKETEKVWDEKNAGKITELSVKADEAETDEEREEIQDSIDALLSKRESAVTSASNRAAANGLKEFRESNNQSGPGRPPVVENDGDSDGDGVREQDLTVSSEDSLQSVFEGFVGLLEETHELSREEIIKELKTLCGASEAQVESRAS